MKIIRYGTKGQEKPAFLDSKNQIRDATSLVSDWKPETIAIENLMQLQAYDISKLPIVHTTERLGTPINNIGKIIGIGLNYKKHAKEAGLPVPEEPIMFMKATSAITGPQDTIELPLGSQTTDWEIELAVVIGKDAKNVSEDSSLDHVAGYMIGNDVSERTFQLERGTQWTKGKSADTFAPLGPWLVTADEIADPQNLNLNLWLNGQKMQTGNSNDMVFTVQQIISKISFYTTLKTGDVIITGTPPGVGYGMSPQLYLKKNDQLKLQIDQLGEQNLKVV